MELYLITGDTQYKTFLDNATHLGCACPETHKGNSFQDVLLFTTTNNLPTINIDNNWVAGVGVIDVSHAAAVVNFYLIAYEQGFEWATWEILNRFVNTFNELIYEGNPVQNRLNLDGTGALETTGLSIGAQNVLGRYNYEFEVFLEDDTADIGFNDMQRLGIMMKNKRILDDGKPLYPENYAPLKKKERTPARIIGL